MSDPSVPTGLWPTGPTPGDPWATVQESLARAAGQALGRFSGPDGAARTPVTLESPVCGLMRADPVAGPRCAEQCDGGVRATLETGRTQVFKCHAGLAVFITPASPAAPGPGRDAPPADALLGGRAFLAYEDLHAFRAYAEELGIADGAVEALVPEVRVAPLERVRSFAAQARATAAAMADLERASAQARTQGDRLRYLMEVFGALEKEPADDLPRAVLHGLGILFGAPGGLVLARAEGLDTLLPVAVFSGNGAEFSEDALVRVRIDAGARWLEPLLGDRRPVHHDTAHHTANDLGRDPPGTGFPPATVRVDAFPLAPPAGSGDTGATGPALVALLNTHLTPEDRVAVGAFCRHAALLLARSHRPPEPERADLAPPSDAGGPDSHGIHAAHDVQESPVPWDTADADLLCRGILARAAASVGAEQGSVMLLDVAERRLRVRAVHGVDLKYLEYIRIRSGEGIAGTVFATGRPMVVADIARDPALKDGMRARYRTPSFLSLPIRMGERLLGVINLADKRGGSFSRGDLRHLVPVAQQAALALERIEALERSEELRKASLTDYLTGLLNRAAFDKRLGEEVERAQRYPFASPMSLLVVDIDDFKRVNDALGLFTGDDCIRACARTLQEGTRTIDSVFRRGGEEFTVILPHTSREAAMTLAERLCQAVAALQVVSKHTPTPVSFTISIGLATYPEDADSEDALFQRANQALHAAKEGGKNQVVTLPPGPPPLA